MDTTQEAGSNLVDCSLMLLDDKEDIDKAWGFVSEQLEKKPFGITNYVSIDGIKDMIYKGEMQLWIAGYNHGKAVEVRICMLTCFLTYQKRKVLFISYVGGSDLRGYINAWPYIRQYAREHDATHIEMHGRKGWSRFSSVLGFKATSINFSVPVHNQKELN